MPETEALKSADISQINEIKQSTKEMLWENDLESFLVDYILRDKNNNNIGDYHAVEKIIFWHEIDSDKFLNKNPSPTEISQTSSLSVVVNNLSISYKNYQTSSPYEENEQIEVAIKASLQDHNNHDDNDDDCQIIENESMMEQQQPQNDNW
ncbi:uncharacterized protein LOC124494535 [Dermatophagoides farinae]|uniref:uncharacterized protein LOC124494535 n=1 Tax=Dermatophagoides farinae TaxID=6954 RepID=UPI003F6391F0